MVTAKVSSLEFFPTFCRSLDPDRSWTEDRTGPDRTGLEHLGPDRTDFYVCSKQDISCVPITNNTHATFLRIRLLVPRFVGIIFRFAPILGRSAEFAKKWHVNFQNFERLKNQEDGSDFDDSWTKSLATTSIFIPQNFYQFFKVSHLLSFVNHDFKHSYMIKFPQLFF